MKSAPLAGWNLHDYEVLEDWVVELRRLPSFTRLAELLLQFRRAATDITFLNLQTGPDSEDDAVFDVDAVVDKGKQREAVPVVPEVGPATVPQLQEQGLVANDPEVLLLFPIFSVFYPTVIIV